MTEIFRYENENVEYSIYKNKSEYIMKVHDGTSIKLSKEEVKYVMTEPDEAALAAQNLWVALLCSKS